MPNAARARPSRDLKMTEAEKRKHSPERSNALMLRLSTSSCPRTRGRRDQQCGEMEQDQDPGDYPEAQASGRTLAIDRGKQHHEQSENQNVEHFVFHELRDAAENIQKSHSRKSKQSAFPLVLSIAQHGKDSRSPKCDRIGGGLYSLCILPLAGDPGQTKDTGYPWQPWLLRILNYEPWLANFGSASRRRNGYAPPRGAGWRARGFICFWAPSHQTEGHPACLG